MPPRKPPTAQEVADVLERSILASGTPGQGALAWNAAVNALQAGLITTKAKARPWLHDAVTQRHGPLVAVAQGTLREYHEDDGKWHSTGGYLGLYFTADGRRDKRSADGADRIFVLTRTRFAELLVEMEAEEKAKDALREYESRQTQAAVSKHHAADVETIIALLSMIDQPGVQPHFQDVADMHSEHVAPRPEGAINFFGTPIGMTINLRGGQITGFAAKLNQLMTGVFDGDILADIIATATPDEWTDEAAQAFAEKVLVALHRSGAFILRGPGGKRWTP